MLIGLVGKPNTGKSTFFKAATLANVLIANYPFATIKPNHGMAYVRIDCIDKEFNVQCQPRTGYCIQHQRFVPVDLMDVAGLVEGASQGKGLGNQFLDDLRQADCFIQIVDASGETDAQGKVISGGYNPCKDVEMLENELDLWYAGILKKTWKTFARTLELEKENFAKAVAKQFSGLKVSEDDVKIVVLRTGEGGRFFLKKGQKVYLSRNEIIELIDKVANTAVAIGWTHGESITRKRLEKKLEVMEQEMTIIKEQMKALELDLLVAESK
jgi:ribosome-binding ATPase YchF (GTP1/OBG family)